MTLLALQAVGAAAGAAPLSAGSGGRFRRTARLLLQTDGTATGIRLAGAVPVRAVFSSREGDALAADAVEHATLSPGGHGLVLQLPAARRITRVTLASAQAGDQVGAYRFDGQAVSSDPVAAAAHGPAGARLDVTDRQLVLKRLRGGQALVLAPAEVRSVFVAYQPLAPRLGFALPADHGPADFAPAAAAPGAADAITVLADFAAPLAARIARLPTPLPDLIAVDLVLEADEPCLAAVAELAFDYVLLGNGFAAAGKRRLTFPGGGAVTRSLQIVVPPTGTIVSFPVKFEGFPAGGEAAGGAPAGAAGAAPAPAPPPANIGLAFSGEETARVRIQLDRAAVVTGAQAELATAEEAEVVASLWDASDGAPRQLSESRAVAVRGGPASIRFAFDPPVAVPGGSASLAFRAARGRAVLGLGTGGAGAVSLDSGGAASTPPAAAGMAPRVSLVRADGDGGGAEAAPFALSLGDRALHAVSDPDGRSAIADLAPLLNALPRPRQANLSLTLTSGLKAAVTIDPPTVVYDLG